MNKHLLNLPMPIPACTQPGNLDFCENLNSFYESARYPEVNPLELRRLIVEAYGRIHSLDVPLQPSMLIMTNGAVDGLNLVLTALSRPDQKVLLFKPSFVAFEHFSKVHRLRCEFVELEGSNLDQLNLDKIRFSNPDFILLSNPNNPTGTSIALKHLDKLCAEVSAYVVVDEAYVEFSERASVINILGRHRNLLILRTFSKAFSLPDVRCGLVIAVPELIEYISKVQIPFNVSSHAQASVLLRLKQLDELVHAWQMLRLERHRFQEGLSQSLASELVLPSDANFVCVRTTSAHDLYENLLKIRVQTLHPSVYPGFLRLSIGKPQHNEVVIDFLRSRAGTSR